MKYLPINTRKKKKWGNVDKNTEIKQPQIQKKVSLNNKIKIGLLSGLSVLVLVSAIAFFNTYLLHYYTSKEENAYQTQTLSSQLLTNLVDAETGQRGYIITGQQSYLAPYNQARQTLQPTITRLLDATPSSDNRQIIQTIDQLAAKKLNELAETISLRQSKGFAAAQAVVLSGQGKDYMDQIRSEIDKLDANEQTIIQTDSNDSHIVRTATTIVIIAGQLLSITIVLFALTTISRDLSERKKVQEALTASEARLHAIVSSMAEGLVVADEKGNFTLFNDAAKQILGLGLTKTHPRDWARVYGNFLPDTVTPFPTEKFPLVRSLKGEKVNDVEMYVRNEHLPSGRFINISSTPLRSDDGKITGSIAVFNDITEKKEAQIKLFAEKAKADAMLSSIGDGVFAINPSGKIILFNKAAELLSGFSAEEAVGQPYDNVLHFFNIKNGDPANAFIKKALKGEKTAMAANTMLHQRGGLDIPVADSAAPIIDQNGNTEGVVVVFRDITREKELERLKDEFVSIASHELRTPMGAIRAFTSMILAGDYGPVNKNLIEPLTDIRSSTLRLVNLVNDMLDATRIEAGRMKFELETLKVNELLHDTTAILIPLAKEKKIALTVKAPKDSLIQADPNKAKQVLTNLLGNSLKFTDKGEIRVTATIEKSSVEIDVRDSGLGIAPEDQARLFHKFQQISSDQKGRPAGTGLGLYISREMIRKMGGELWIKSSEAGKGSVFAFTLPLADTALARRIKKQMEKEAQLHPDQK